MFGIKIISEKKHNELIGEIEDLTVKLNDAIAKRQGSESTIHKLSQQLADKTDKNVDLISEKSYLNQKVIEFERDLADFNKRIAKLTAKNEELKAFKRDVLEALGGIDLGDFRLSVCNKKCDTCDKEPTDCKKYTFGDHTFCVIPKQ